MMEPWEFKTDDSRKADSKRVFIIFCEDGAVEPLYFESFRQDDIQISIRKNTKQHHAQVDNATEYLRKHGLIEVNENRSEVLKVNEGTQVWCVFDRDKEPDDGKDAAFNDSIETANRRGIKTAWSNDNFELWILLHFEEVDMDDKSYFSRTKYYERLTEILKKNYPDEPLFLNPKFDYYTTMKSKNRFLQYTYKLMKENLDTAIERAEKLEKFHSAPPPKALHLHCPCTKVHHLVKELIS